MEPQVRVKVKYFTVLRETTKKRMEDIELASGSTVKDLLRLLSERYGQRFEDYVYNQYGRVRSGLQFLVNGRSTKSLQGFQTRLEEGDEFAIIPPVGGG